MTPKNPESFMKVSRRVSEIFGILLSNPVAYLKKETTRTESIKILLHSIQKKTMVTTFPLYKKELNGVPI